MSVHLLNIINRMYIYHLVKGTFPPIQNTLWNCEQITILFLYNIISRLLPFLKFVYAAVKILMFVFLLISRSLNLTFIYSLFFILNILLVLGLHFFKLSPWNWLGFCNHCNLACFRWYVNFEHSSSNYGFLNFSL